MSSTPAPWSLQERIDAQAEQADREVRMSDFVLMALLPLRSLEVERLPVNELALLALQGFPVNELAVLALVGLCLFRRPRNGARLPGLVVMLLVVLLGLFTFSGVANQADWIRRVGHVGIMAGLVWAMGTGRISLRSAALGLGAGLLSVMALALLGVGGDAYPGRLTGFLADPNAGAYFIAVLGLVAVFYSDDRWQVRLALAIPLSGGLVLTFSRTGLLAAALALAWVALGRRLNPLPGVAVAGAVVWMVKNVPDDLTTIGPFSDRSGSDQLRKRIVAQQQVKLEDVPWFGTGPGTAKVEVRGLEFFFHNSYLATRQEGGWAALGLVLALLVFAFLRLSARSRRGDLAAASAQGALIAVAVMAITLGEVLLEIPMAIAVGFALGDALLPRRDPGGTPDG